MRLHIANWKWACIPAAILTGFGMLVVFGFQPGGFESQGVWLLLLLPGTLAAYPLSDLLDRFAPHAEPVIFWVLVFASISFGIGQSASSRLRFFALLLGRASSLSLGPS